jgi:hypothetical protein
MFIQCVDSPQNLLHARAKTANPRGPIFLINERIMEASVRERQGKSGRVQIDVHAMPTWRVGLLPRALGDPRTLEMQRSVNDFFLATPICLLPKGTEGEGLVVVTCVGSVHNRKSIFANIPVG